MRVCISGERPIRPAIVAEIALFRRGREGHIALICAGLTVPLMVSIACGNKPYVSHRRRPHEHECRLSFGFIAEAVVSKSACMSRAEGPSRGFETTDRK